MTNKEMIKELAKDLRLKVVANYEEHIESNKEFEELLLKKLLEIQVAKKKAKSIERRTKKANFPVVKTLDLFEFDKDRLPHLDKKQVENLATCEFIEEKRNVVAIGNSGTGKTHIVTSLGVEAIRKGYHVRFKKALALVTEMSKAQEENQLVKYIKSLNKCQLLIIDELGYLEFDKKGASLLFQIIDDRSEQKSTLITTNLEFSKWVNFLGDHQLAAALIDRLTYRTIFLNMNGESYRLKNANAFLNDIKT